MSSLSATKEQTTRLNRRNERHPAETEVSSFSSYSGGPVRGRLCTVPNDLFPGQNPPRSDAGCLPDMPCWRHRFQRRDLWWRLANRGVAAANARWLCMCLGLPTCTESPVLLAAARSLPSPPYVTVKTLTPFSAASRS